MPLLQFDTTLSLSAAEKTSFANTVTKLYTTEMNTTDGHVAVTIRNRKPADLHLGRAVDGPLLFLDAEIRRDVPDENMKVVFTEHPGDAMMGVDRVGGEWNGE